MPFRAREGRRGLGRGCPLPTLRRAGRRGHLSAGGVLGAPRPAVSIRQAPAAASADPRHARDQFAYVILTKISDRHSTDVEHQRSIRSPGSLEAGLLLPAGDPRAALRVGPDSMGEHDTRWDGFEPVDVNESRVRRLGSPPTRGCSMPPTARHRAGLVRSRWRRASCACTGRG